MQTTYPRPHIYGSDGVTDFYGNTRCTRCGLASDHKIHALPDQPAEQAALEHRKIGEAE